MDEYLIGVAFLRIREPAQRAHTPRMPQPALPTHIRKPTQELEFEIGDHVCLRTNPQWIGVVVARSLAVNVHVLWTDHGVEPIDSRLLKFVSARN
jgi:hypothetical protein